MTTLFLQPERSLLDQFLNNPQTQMHFIYLGLAFFILSPLSLATELGFKTEIDQFKLFIQTSYGMKIHFSRDWDDDERRFSASATTIAGRVIRVSGHDFRSNTLRAFRLGLCHEVGHYLGGPPYLQIDNTSIHATLNQIPLSTEGQADYFASFCLKKYYRSLQIKSPELDQKSLPEVLDFCRENPECEYIASAALDLVNYINVKNSPNQPILFNSYSETQPSNRTLDRQKEYPTLNCRLLTFLSGALCENDFNESHPSGCQSGRGARPECWFVKTGIPLWPEKTDELK